MDLLSCEMVRGECVAHAVFTTGVVFCFSFTFELGKSHGVSLFVLI